MEKTYVGFGMRLMATTSTRLLLGTAVGAAVGVSCPIIVIGYASWLDGTQFPKLSAELLLPLSVFAGPAAVNGALGAWVAARYGKQSGWPVAILPVALPVVATFATLLADAKTRVGMLYFAVLATLFSWLAGRIGQRIGSRPGD